MNMVAFLPVLALGLAPDAQGQPVNPKSPLAVLMPTAETLPACARLRKIEPGDPPSLSSNPQISSDPEFLALIARPLAPREGPSGKVEGLREGLVALFWEEQQKEDVLFMAAVFDQPAQAAQAHENVKASFGKDPDIVVFAKGGVVALTRNMGFSPSCFAELRKALEDRWNSNTDK